MSALDYSEWNIESQTDYDSLKIVLEHRVCHQEVWWGNYLTVKDLLDEIEMPILRHECPGPPKKLVAKKCDCCGSVTHVPEGT